MFDSGFRWRKASDQSIVAFMEPSQSQPTQVDIGYTQEYGVGSYPEVIDDTPKPWIRLISLHSSIDPKEFFESDQTLYDKCVDAKNSDSECLYEVGLGRSKKSTMSFDSAKVSNSHCKIYCKKVFYQSNNKTCYYLQPYILDTSANGTYINRNIRLQKNLPRLLRNGEEVSLIDYSLLNAPMNDLAKKNLKTEIEKHSFMVVIPANDEYASAIGGGVSAAAAMSVCNAVESPVSTRNNNKLHRESTVVKMVKQQRSISDYYVISKQLGAGGCGVVFEGIHKFTGITYAIKKMDIHSFVLKNHHQTTDEGIHELLKEAELLRLIKHPDIIHLEDVFADSHYLYLVMELLSGGDLFDRLLSKGTYSEGEAMEVCYRLLNAIHFLHINNIAHRDLKPENILLVSAQSDIEVKLTDFGLAKQIDETKKLKTYCGTPQYFAPEVYHRQHAKKKPSGTHDDADCYTIAADMWSLGVMLYVLLSASYPFKEVQGTEVPVDMLQGKFGFTKPIWSRISANCKNFITQLLQKDAKNRLTSSDALNHVWFNPISSKRKTAPLTMPVLPKPVGVMSPVKLAAVPEESPISNKMSVSQSFIMNMEESMQISSSSSPVKKSKTKDGKTVIPDSVLMPPPSNKKRKVNSISLSSQDPNSQPEAKGIAMECDNASDSAAAAAPLRVTRSKAKSVKH